MSNDNPQWGPYGAGPQPGYQWQPGGWGAGGPYGWAGPGAGPGAGAGPRARIDALDVLEGVLKDGFSLSNFTRIARASGSNFWIGAAIGAGLVVLMNRPDVREAFSHAFKGHEPAPEAPAGPPKV